MPNFPFRRDLEDVLRSRYRQSRRERQPQLGTSSLTRGDGALELRDTDGRTVHRFGDGPDGQFGILVQNSSGTWITIQQDAQHRVDTYRAVADARMGQIEAVDAAQDGRLDSHGQHLSDHGSRIIAAEGTLGRHQTRLDSHGSTLGQHGSRIIAAEGALGQHQTRLDSHGSTLGQHGSRIIAAEGALEDLEKDTLANEVTLANLRSRILRIEQQLGIDQPPGGGIGL